MAALETGMVEWVSFSQRPLSNVVKCERAVYKRAEFYHVANPRCVLFVQQRASASPTLKHPFVGSERASWTPQTLLSALPLPPAFLSPFVISLSSSRSEVSSNSNSSTAAQQPAAVAYDILEDTEYTERYFFKSNDVMFPS